MGIHDRGPLPGGSSLSIPRQGWEKRGLLLGAPTPQSWARSHAALPIADVADEDGFWLYYSPRDELGRAHVARARIVERKGSLGVVEHQEHPVLSPGALGAFDDSGVTCSCLVDDGARKLLYYTGWTLGVSVPFYFYVGLAVSEDGGATFERLSSSPILERNPVDPYLTASPCVVREDGKWRMWYVSCVRWLTAADGPRHLYHVRYAESDDGLNWRREGRIAIDFADAEEYAIARPCVTRDGDRYRMWFSHRGSSYRIGYAESDDGLAWRRDDRVVGLEPSVDGWDAEMLAYPFVVSFSHMDCLLYNGNGYGRTGIGYAVRPSVFT